MKTFKRIASTIVSLVLLFVLITPASAVTVYPHDENNITVDGNVTSEEWGAPSFSTDYTGCWAKAPSWDFWYFTNPTPVPTGQKVDVYLTKDDDFIYLAVKLVNATGQDASITAIGDAWKSAHLGFTMSKYESGTIVPRIEYAGNWYEQYTGYFMAPINGTDKGIYGMSQGIAPALLTDEQYSISFDAATNTYTYEVAVPYVNTNITPGSNDAVVVSLDVADIQTLGKNGNRYILSTAASSAASGGLGAGVFTHSSTNPLVFDFSEHKVTTVASPIPAGITIDGSITTAEWGEPVIITNPLHCQETWGNYWEYDPAGKKIDQLLKLYVTNDADYIYVGATLDKAELDAGCTSVSEIGKYAHLGFTLSPYNSTTTVDLIEYMGEYYEQYLAYYIGFVNGVPGASTSSQGMTAEVPAADDYTVAYDAASKTYTYEVRIPYDKTTVKMLAGREIVMSVSAAGEYTTGPNANRYNLTSAFSSCGGPNNFAHVDNALHIMLNDITPGGAKVGTVAAPIPDEIVIDGNITTTEWGEPVIITNPAHCQTTWGNYWQFSPDKVDPVQQMKVYLTNDEDYIYVGATLDRADLDTTCTNAGELWKDPHFGFTLSAYNSTTTVERIEFAGDMYEKYLSYYIGFVNGVPGASSSSQGMTAEVPVAENYTVAYDAVSKTYTYEVRIPYDKTNVSMFAGQDIALSISAAGESYAALNANRYNVTTGMASSGGPNNFAHHNNALKITLNDITPGGAKVGTVASPVPTAIAIDGSITATEWGEPVIITNPAHCQDTWGNYWQFDPASIDPAQQLKVYLTNDKEYIYVGATIDRAELDTTCTTPADLWKAAHFGFSISQYNDDTTVPRVEYLGDDYEAYTAFYLGLVNGVPGFATMTQGLTAVDPSPEDYTVNYNATTKTYTYEIRIPFKETVISLIDSRDIALSVTASGEYVAGPAANAYNLTTGTASMGGPNNFAHYHNALKITLNDTSKKVTTYATYEASPEPTALTIDGVISDAEWGNPMIVTTPNFAKETWGDFWEFDAAAVNREQVLKVYLTNDINYIYIGATLDECDFDASCTDSAVLYKAAHFGFTISQYDEETSVKRIEYKGKTYEQYTSYMLGFVNGKPVAIPLTQGLDAVELGDDDYAVKYDPATRTYTYEIRLAYKLTNIPGSRKAALSVYAAAPYTTGEGANRYNLTTGAAFSGGPGNFAHLGKVMAVYLNSNPNTSDTGITAAAVVAAAVTAGLCILVIKRRKVSSVKR